MKQTYNTINEFNESGLFKKKGWHHNLYRYNFVHAAGDFFAKFDNYFDSSTAKTFRKEYIQITKDLAQSTRINKVIFSIHFISNSLKNDRDKNEKLDPELADILKSIKDRNLFKNGEFTYIFDRLNRE